jgi:non-specific serine/threonine protein kinase/serine/threonine-protein kinase
MIIGTRMENGGQLDPQRTLTIGASGGQVPSDSSQPTIARYRVVSLIGEGGMGAVYEAEQDQPRRTVALKVIKPGMASPDMLRRFEQEALALGRLQHPGIAQIYEAGSAESAYGPQPYFAMEYIRGRGLRDFANEQKPNTVQRLELMAKICDAVHHAHQRGLIHRDLKPANILVDETAQPKILDFGVARLTDRDAQTPSHTDVGQLIGTLAYMSPEQVLADPLELDTRSDVYTLGVILYELLAGKLPYNIGTRLHEAMSAIRDAEPTPLGSVNREFRGDIETIVAKALEKDKMRRYQSAAELSADIRRFLNDEPVMARPPSIQYQVGKFARKNRVLVGGFVAVFLALVGGIAASMWQANRATRAEQAAVQDRDRAVNAERTATEDRNRAVTAEGQARTAEVQARTAEGQARSAEAQARKDRDEAVAQKERADSEAEVAKAVSDFMQKNLFEQASGQTQGKADTSVRGALDRAAQKIEGAYSTKPLVEAGVRDSIGGAYLTLNAFPEALSQAERAYALRRSLQGEEHPATIKTLMTLSAIYLERSDPRAAAMINKVYDVQLKTLGEEHEDTIGAKMLVGILHMQQANFDLARSTLTSVAEMSRRKLGPAHQFTQLSQQLLLSLPPARPQTNEERARRLDTLAAGFGAIEQNSIQQVIADATLNGSSLAVKGDLAAAEAEYKRGMDVLRSAGAEDARLLRDLQEVLQRQRKDQEAETYLKALAALNRRTVGLNNSQARLDLVNLSRLYLRMGKYAESETVMQELHDAQAQFLGAETLNALVSEISLAWLRWKQSKNTEAVNGLRSTIAILQRTAENTWERYNAEGLLAAIQGNEGLLTSSVNAMSAREPSRTAGGTFFTLDEAKAVIEQAKQRGAPASGPAR